MTFWLITFLILERSWPWYSWFWRRSLSNGHVFNPRVSILLLFKKAHADIPRLMPNKYRHIGIVISDGFVFFIVVVGPVVGRYAIDVGDNWRFIYYGGRHFGSSRTRSFSLTALCRIHSRDSLPCILIPALPSTTASQRCTVEGGFGRSRLCWRPSCHAWCGSYFGGNNFHCKSRAEETLSMAIY